MFRKSGIVSALAVLCLAITATAASMVTSWHGLSQNQRNALILSTAMSQAGRYTGQQCKVWVQNVVYQASGGTVYPPQNLNDWTWYSSNDVQPIASYGQISRVQPGQIIQMRWTNRRDGHVSPHTAIVTSTTGAGMYWVDCNFVSTGTVGVHYVSYQDFQISVGPYFNIYEIR